MIDHEGITQIWSEIGFNLALLISHAGLLVLMLDTLATPHIQANAASLAMILLATGWASMVSALSAWLLLVLSIQIVGIRQEGGQWKAKRFIGSWIELAILPEIRSISLHLPSLWSPYVRSGRVFLRGGRLFTVLDRLPHYERALNDLGVNAK